MDNTNHGLKTPIDSIIVCGLKEKDMARAVAALNGTDQTM